MKKLLLGLLLASISSVSMAEEQVDWTPLFKSWEKGCEFSTAYEAFVDNLLEGKEPKVVLPGQYMQAINPKLKTVHHKSNDGMNNYYEYSVDVLKGTYYDIPVTKLGFEAGEGNGIYLAYLELKPSDHELRKLLATVDFEQAYSEELGIFYGGKVSVKMDSATVICDRSN